MPYRQWPELAIGGAHAVENSKLAFLLARHVAGVPVVVPPTPLEIAVFSHAKMLGRSQVIKVSDKITVYVDGAHTPESVSAAASWFFSLPETQPTTNARNVLLFYSTRDAKSLFKTLMPYTRQLTKSVICTIKSPRYTAQGMTDDAQEHLLNYVEVWRQLYKEVPCLPCVSPFESFEDVEELVLGSTGELEDERGHVNLFVTGSFFLVGELLHRLEQAGVSTKAME